MDHAFQCILVCVEINFFPKVTVTNKELLILMALLFSKEYIKNFDKDLKSQKTISHI